MAGSKQPWKGYIPPFRLWGNVYFVGTTPASTHIIDTGDGLIMLDSGYQHSLYLVLQNMHTLGLDPMELKYIVHTHGHIDHCGATAALTHLTGAKTFIGAKEAIAALKRAGVSQTVMLTGDSPQAAAPVARELGLELEPFQPDVLLRDGDRICLGNTEITAVATPGHTPGAMSLFFGVSDGTRHLRAALHGGAGLNSMRREFLEKYSLPLTCRQDFLSAMDRLAAMDVDIFLGNHVEQNQTPERRERLLSGDTEAFVDREAWGTFCQRRKAAALSMLESEARDM